MSERDTESAAEFNSKQAFFEAVREDGAVVGETEYFTEGNGAATSYKARTDDGEIEDVKKAEVEAAWQEHHGGGSADDDDTNDGPEDVHLGTFYFSKANWDLEQDRKTLQECIEKTGWYIDSEVDSGGYRIKTTR